MQIHIDILKDAKFRNLFLGSFSVFFGAGLTTIASSWYLLQTTGKASAVALSWIAFLISGPLIFVYSGAFIDRFDRRRLIIIMCILRAMVVSFVPIAVYFKFFSIWQLYVVFFFEGIGFNVSIPTEKALMQEIIKKDDWIVANSLTEMTIQSAIFLSAGICGFIFNKIGLAGIMAINCATYLLSTFFFSHIPKLSTFKQHMPQTERFFDSVIIGWKFLLKHKTILAVGVISFIPTTIAFVSNSVTPIYVEKTLRKGATEYGIIEMCYGIGAFASGILAPYAIRLGKNAISMVMVVILLFILASMPFNNHFWLAAAGFAIFGLVNAGMRIVFSTTLMELAPNELMGRISSVSMLMSYSIQLISFGIVGYVVDHVAILAGFYYLALFALLILISLIVERNDLRRRWELNP